MSGMRILFLDHAPYEGGAEVSLKQLIERLDRKRFELAVAAPADAPYLKDLMTKQVRHISVRYNWKKYGLVWPLLWDLAMLLRVVNVYRPDIIHTNTRVTNLMGGLIYLLRPMMPAFSSVKVINHVRDKDPLPRWKFRLIGACDQAISNSHQVKDFLVQGGVPAEKIEVIYNGVDLLEFRKLTKQDKDIEVSRHKNRPTITFIGQIYPRKGLNFLIDALVGVKRDFPDVVLRVVGRDPTDDQRHIKAYQKQLKDLGIADQVEWLGYRQNIAEILAQTDVFVLPALEEPFGRVLIEAMAMEVPVVATKVGGIPEIVVDGVTGWLVPSRDANELAGRIVQLLRDASMRAEFGRRGRKIVEERFSLERHVKGVEGMYNRLTQ